MMMSNTKTSPTTTRNEDDFDDAFVLTASKLGRLFKRSRWWGQRVLREWLREQERGGPVRVFFKRNGRPFTTVAIVEAVWPRARRDEQSERRIKALEADLERAFTRIAELERKIGARR